MNKLLISKWLSLDPHSVPQTACEFEPYWEGQLDPSHCGIDIPESWIEPVHIALTCMRTLDEDFKIHQIKEKFNGLRIYYSTGASPAVVIIMRLIVDWAERVVADIERDS